jgi:hypothetical protein
MRRMDELAKIYIRYQGKVYRLKVFPTMLWIEQQPGGNNVPLDRRPNTDARAVYEIENGVWNWDAIRRLTETYRVRRR